MKKQVQLWFRGVSVVCMAVTLLLVGCNTSTDVSKPIDDEAIAPAPVVAASAPVASSAPGGLPQESIKVHGQWTIEVRNPDGTLAEIREFENALTAGDISLSYFLGREKSVGGWHVLLMGNPGTSGAFNPSNNSKRAYIWESTFSPPEGMFNTLTVDVPDTGPNTDKLVLSGTATATQNGNIGYVRTIVAELANTSVPSSSYSDATLREFTTTTLASPIVLLAGQQVLVTVVISFN